MAKTPYQQFVDRSGGGPAFPNRDPWQLYSGHHNADAARADLESAWLIASKFYQPEWASRFMEAVMQHYASAGACDSEGYQELNRRIRRIWPEWS